jgi:MinD superfamily P-loop ATPase
LETQANVAPGLQPAQAVIIVTRPALVGMGDRLAVIVRITVKERVRIVPARQGGRKSLIELVKRVGHPLASETVESPLVCSSRFS